MPRYAIFINICRGKSEPLSYGLRAEPYPHALMLRRRLTIFPSKAAAEKALKKTLELYNAHLWTSHKRKTFLFIPCETPKVAGS